jgi:hypothetical protein
VAECEARAGEADEHRGPRGRLWRAGDALNVNVGVQRIIGCMYTRTKALKFEAPHLDPVFQSR